jgi:hypothetical protein
MFTAYEAYKASVNPDKKERTGDAPTQVQSTVKTAEAAKKKIETIEPRNLYLEEKVDLTAALNALKGTIETLLAAIAEPETEETETDKLSLQAAGPETTTKKKAV